MNKRIIVIEDDGDLGWLVQLRLQQAGYEVDLAADGATGLQQFLGQGADLLLLDMNLPVMDGREVFTRVREVSEVPVVLITAYIWGLEDLQELGLDAEHYMPKPFSPKALVSRVQSLLGASFDEAQETPVALVSERVPTELSHNLSGAIT